MTVLGTLAWNGGTGTSSAATPEPVFLPPSARCDISPDSP